MTANLFQDNVILVRKPAWHGLGLVLDEPVSAVEAFRLYGAYDITKEPLYFADGTPAHRAALVRDPVPGDPVRRIFNIVSDSYEHVAPQEFAETWDDATGIGIESLGAIGRGEKMFITARLDVADIGQDKVENYLFALADWGGGAMHVMITPVRVVCQNTVNLGFQNATMRVGIVHLSGARQRLANALMGMADKAQKQNLIIRDAFERLTRVKISDQQAIQILAAVYKPYDLNKYQEHRRYFYEDKNQRIEKSADLAYQLFAGALTGYNETTAGTAWGLFQAVVEVENYYVDARKESTRNANILAGDRAMYMARAYDALRALK
jgi:phage/plasmid-like protein (TIGR03299 family)